MDTKEFDISFRLSIPQASVHIKTSTTSRESLSGEAVTSASVMTLASTALRE